MFRGKIHFLPFEDGRPNVDPCVGQILAFLHIPTDPFNYQDGDRYPESRNILRDSFSWKKAQENSFSWETCLFRARALSQPKEKTQFSSYPVLFTWYQSSIEDNSFHGQLARRITEELVNERLMLGLRKGRFTQRWKRWLCSQIEALNKTRVIRCCACSAIYRCWWPDNKAFYNLDHE